MIRKVALVTNLNKEVNKNKLNGNTHTLFYLAFKYIKLNRKWKKILILNLIKNNYKIIK